MKTSVVILTRNAGPGFAETLAALATQEPPPVSVVVIDSGSTDGTLDVARRYSVELHEIPVTEFDFGTTRDLAYSLVDTELIANLSQDVIPKGPDWLAALTEPFAAPRVAYVSARCEARDPESMFIWQRLGRFYFTREMARYTRRYGVPCSNANSCVRRSVWETLPHGPMPIAEDLLFQKRAVEAGHEIAYVEEATAWHQHAFTTREAFLRAWNEGMAMRHLGVPYGFVDSLSDLLRPDIWATLLRQIRYGRIRSASGLLYPAIRPLAVLGGQKLGRRYWR